MSKLTDLIFDQARQAWGRVKTGNFNDWMTLGEGLALARTEAFRVTGTNDVNSKHYRNALPAILDREGLGKIDAPLRSEILTLIDNRPAVEAWRATLADNQRMMWNHPHTVLKYWRKATIVAETAKADPGAEKEPTWKEKAAALENQLAAVKEQLRKAQQDGSLFNLREDKLEEIVDTIAATVSGHRLKQLAQQLAARARNGSHAG
jgi:hypothetical protein